MSGLLHAPAALSPSTQPAGALWIGD